MVRLKVSRPHSRRRRKEISIPYGSIKRAGEPLYSHFDMTFQFLMVRLKDAGINPHEVAGTPFQFLMVRLKVRALDLKNYQSLFQFLMVRLKVFHKYQVHKANHIFQFLMVRLKVPVLVVGFIL